MRTGPAVVLAGGIAYALGAASTRPFTLPADVLTALAIVVLAVLVVVRWPLRTRTVRAEPEPGPGPGPGGHPYLPWLVLLVVFTAWELVNYAAPGSRGAHPTFSSITDAVNRFYLLKAALFLGWLYFGWVILYGGAPRDSPGPPPGPP